GRMCLGSRGGLRKADGRERGGLGLRRRQQVDRALRGRWYRYHRPRRVGADHVRPGRHLVRKAAEGVLRRGARSHAAESPGPRRRDAVSLVDLLLGAGTAGSRRGYIRQLNAAKVFRSAIVTKVVPLEGFYPAEAYHQHFLVQHPDHPYIVYNDLPKLERLKKEFPELLRR